VALAFGIQVLGNVKDDIGVSSCADRTDTQTSYNATGDRCFNSTANSAVGSAEYNGTSDGITGVSKLTGKLPTIGLVLAAVVVIGVLVKGFSRAQ
jgi:hypothetical protein